MLGFVYGSDIDIMETPTAWIAPCVFQYQAMECIVCGVIDLSTRLDFMCPTIKASILER